MSYRKLLALLLAFLRPRVDGDAPPADPPAGGDPPSDDPDIDPDAGNDDPPADDEPPAPNAALETAQREARENKERADRYEREAADLRARSQPRPDTIEQQEDARLNDPQASDLEKWQIRANRALRVGQSQAQAALAQAADVSDRTSFQSIAMNDPLAKKYETRVEQELAKMRSAGQNAGREAIYTFLLGKDMREGKFKKKAAAQGGGNEPVNRGKLPGARTDVPGKGAQSEREKRAARLANVQI